VQASSVECYSNHIITQKASVVLIINPLILITGRDWPRTEQRHKIEKNRGRPWHPDINRSAERERALVILYYSLQINQFTNKIVKSSKYCEPTYVLVGVGTAEYFTDSICADEVLPAVLANLSLEQYV